MERFEADTECKACGGTGLFVGMAERGGDAVVCHTCRGTGCHRVVIEYEPFRARKPRKGILRVFQTNPGIVTAPRVVPGGVPASQWAEDPESARRPGAEMREHTCPAWWYQCTDCHKKPNWRECGFGRFTDCQHFPRKSECWARWDAEQKGSEE